jgi:FAD/FMN-containing dehydrogenase
VPFRDRLLDAADARGLQPTSQYLKSMTVGKDQPLSKAATDAMFRYLHGASPGHGLVRLLPAPSALLSLMRPAQLWFVLADFELGAIADPAPDATAYVHRDVLYTLAAYVIDPVPGRAFPAAGLAFLDGWTHALTAAAPANAFGVYPGYVDPALAPAPAARAYWGANLPRLAELKRRYDPGEVFRNPQSVRPMRAPGDPALDEDEEKPRPAQNRNRRYCNCEIA